MSNAASIASRTGISLATSIDAFKTQLGHLGTDTACRTRINRVLDDILRGRIDMDEDTAEMMTWLNQAMLPPDLSVESKAQLLVVSDRVTELFRQAWSDASGVILEEVEEA
jgi:hypothetical protein